MTEDGESPTGPIINELLCFVANKISLMDTESLVYLCAKTFDDKDIETSKELLFGLLHDENSSVEFTKRKASRHKAFDSKKVKNLNDIIVLFQEKGSDTLPQFVALDLGKLPPISINHIDATALVVQAENVMTKVDVIQTAL